MTELKPAILTCLEQLRCFCDNFHFICAQFNPKPCDICLSRLDTSEDMQLLLSCHLIMKGVRPSFALLFKNIYSQSSESIYFLQLFSWWGWWDPQQWSEELGSEISLSHLKHTSSVFSAWQTHFPDSSPFNWTVFADHSTRGNISFYNFYNLIFCLKQGQKDLLDTEFLNFRYCLNVTIFKYLIPINQLPDLGYW